MIALAKPITPPSPREELHHLRRQLLEKILKSEAQRRRPK